MRTSLFIIENRTTGDMHFHIEPECTDFTISPGQSAEVSGAYANEPITIQFSDADGMLFGAVFPGDGEVDVRIDGRDVADVTH